jgi:hypothetical protein
MLHFPRVARSLLIVGAAVGSGTLVSACGGTSHASAGHISLSRAADISTAQPGYKVHLTMNTTVGGQSFAVTGQGSIDTKPLQGSMQMSITANGRTLPVQAVLADDTIYEQLPAQYMSQLPGDKQWISINLAELAKLTKLPGLRAMMGSSQTMTNPGQYMDFLRAAAPGSVHDLGQVTVDGVQTTHYSAQVDLARLADAVPAAERAAARQFVQALQSRFHGPDKLPMDVWIDQTGLIRKVQAQSSETVDGKSVAVSVTELVTAYGTQPAPTVPSPSETVDLLSLIPHG